jgi:hypothetical protein
MHKRRDDRDDFIHRLPLARIYAGKTILQPARLKRKKIARSQSEGVKK